MCYIIITCRSMLWTLLSITSFMMILAAVTSPHWLVGYARHHGVSSIHLQGMKNDTTASQPASAPTPTNYNPADHSPDSHDGSEDGEDLYRPTLGIFNRCHKLHQFQFLSKRENCATFVTDFLLPDAQFPDAWKAALVFFGLAGVLLLGTCIAAVLSLCVRSMCGKSIFTLSGLVQSIAGLFCILGLVIYPAGWGSDKVKGYCGQFSGPFDMDNCYLDASTSSHKVEEEVLEGKNLICVL
nr:hypothetical protein BaRGS_010174 [Batillaria attramentaria]